MGQMHADDMDLVRDFAANGSEGAFATLVGRHVNLVYSAALRRLGNANEAEEVAQAVFIILAKKAGSLRRGTILSGWLYQTAQLTAANFQRAALRRQRREQEAFMQFAEQSQPDVSWHRLGPLLEEAMMRLGPKERDAVVLRFFENRTVREVASALGLREDAAQKRVNRATDKLRDYFVRRGVQVSTTALLALIGTHAVQAAPVELGGKIAATAALKGAAGSGSMLTLIKTTLKIMAWTKAKMAVMATMVVILATVTTVMVHELKPSGIDAYISDRDLGKFLKAPPLLVIQPTHFPGYVGTFSRSQHRYEHMKMAGRDRTLSDLIATAYDFRTPRIIFPVDMPTNKYDYIVTVPDRPHEAFQARIQSQLGYTARKETREVDALVLKVANSRKLETLKIRGGGRGKPNDANRMFDSGPTVDVLVWELEYSFAKPVVDRTGLTNHDYYDFGLDWRWQGNDLEANRNSLRQALLDQLGLELVPDRQPIEMLIVEKAP
jgi:uncharacterized protein (TIGR03435 family)